MNRYVYGRRLIDERQRYRRWIDPRFASLRVVDIVAYLRERGWTEVPPDRPNALVFREPGTPEGATSFYEFVPTGEEYADYKQQLFELLSGLANDDICWRVPRSSITIPMTYRLSGVPYCTDFFEQLGNSAARTLGTNANGSGAASGAASCPRPGGSAGWRGTGSPGR